MTSKKVFIILLNWNGKDDTLSCLHSLQALKYPNYEIVVVDNGSSDGSVEQIKTHHPKSIVIETGRNLGFAEGNNVGIRYALDQGGEFILILNNDTVVDPDFLSELVKTAEDTQGQAILSPVIFYMDTPDLVWFAGAKWNPDLLKFDYLYQDEPLPSISDSSTDYACGAAMFFSSDIAKKIGLLDPQFFLVWEESDWCFRARNAGYHCQVVPGSRIWHKVGASFDTESSPLRQYFSYRNRLLWAEKHLPLNNLFSLILNSLFAFMPRITISRDKNTALSKRVVWTLLEWSKTWKLPILVAKRRALFDYIFRRFGDCPISIRQLNRQ